MGHPSVPRVERLEARDAPARIAVSLRTDGLLRVDDDHRAGAVRVEQFGHRVLVTDAAPGGRTVAVAAARVRAVALIGNGGDDRLISSLAVPTLVDAGPGDDYAATGAGYDVVIAGPGDDVVNAGAGNDVLDGGPGRDTLYGGFGPDLLYGGPGADALRGGPGADRMAPGDRGPDAGDVLDYSYSPLPIYDRAYPVAVPVETPHDYGRRRHREILADATRTPADVLFVGDSHSDNARRFAAWNAAWAGLATYNAGISADKTQTLLWRLTAGGELAAHPARVVSVLIGSNNLYRQTGAQVADGVTAAVEAIREILPDALVVVTTLIPRAAWRPPQPAFDFTARLAETNRALDDLRDLPGVQLLDVRRRFLLPNGALNSALFRDGLHFNYLGYRVWAKYLGTKVRGMLGLPPLTPAAAKLM